MAADRGSLERPPLLSTRAIVFLGIVLAGVGSFAGLGLSLEQLLPGDGLWPEARDLRILGRFLARAFTPALEYEATFVPSGAMPLPLKALDAAHRTLVYASMAMSLALAAALPLGLLASSAWWRTEVVAPPSFAGRSGRAVLYAGIRGLIEEEAAIGINTADRVVMRCPC